MAGRFLPALLSKTSQGKIKEEYTILLAAIPLTLLLLGIMAMLWPRRQRTLKEIAIESAQIFAIVGGLAILTCFGNMPDELYRLCFKAFQLMMCLGIIRIGLMLTAYAAYDRKSKKQD